MCASNTDASKPEPNLVFWLGFGCIAARIPKTSYLPAQDGLLLGLKGPLIGPYFGSEICI